MISETEATYSEELYQVPPRVVIVLGVAWHSLPEGDKSLLTKILAAARRTVHGAKVLTADVLSTSDFDYGSNVISFGVPFSPELPPYQLTEDHSSQFIYADALSVLDEAKKKSLWMALKKMFVV